MQLWWIHNRLWDGRYNRAYFYESFNEQLDRVYSGYTWSEESGRYEYVRDFTSIDEAKAVLVALVQLS